MWSGAEGRAGSRARAHFRQREGKQRAEVDAVLQPRSTPEAESLMVSLGNMLRCVCARLRVREFVSLSATPCVNVKQTTQLSEFCLTGT